MVLNALTIPSVPPQPSRCSFAAKRSRCGAVPLNALNSRVPGFVLTNPGLNRVPGFVLTNPGLKKTAANGFPISPPRLLLRPLPNTSPKPAQKAPPPLASWRSSQVQIVLDIRCQL